MFAYESQHPFSSTAAKRPERNSWDKCPTWSHRRLDAESSKYRMAYYIFDSLRHATCPREAFERLCRRAVCGLGSGESRGAQLGDIRLRAEWAQAGGGSPAPLGKSKHVRRKR